ncbi:unnamed protein product [Urochloa decumbens]|uniref:J domain-containing protein n=1 Tax=Urochloa decumbens TaxID=240449 RepID=A0ABC9BCQ5_9POAL
MAGGGGGKNGVSLYAVLGVASDCSDADLRSAYRKLAMVRAVLAACCSASTSASAWLLCFRRHILLCPRSPVPLARPLLDQKWHPDKCAGAGSSGGGGGADAAKARFQKIQGAYAVLSDPNKRILYDVGAYDSDGDDDGAGEILGDILDAMSQNGPAENGKGESLEDMQRQFEELFLRPSPSSFYPPDDSGKSASRRRAARK